MMPKTLLAVVAAGASTLYAASGPVRSPVLHQIDLPPTVLLP